ncbi:MAG: TldD/PmbA family protein [Syntrophomonadaceae bacterium]|jgi:TldD protein|nr:TldD/PmbA family protein [Syntrophomonadaceae bacterium]
MLDKALLAEVIGVAYGQGLDLAEIYVEEKQVGNIWLEDNRIEKIHSGREKGAGIRVVKANNTAYVYTNDLSRQGLIKAAALARDAIGGQLGSQQAASSWQERKAPLRLDCLSLDWEERIQLIMEANQAARGVSQLIRQVMIAAADVQKQIQIANSRGEYIEEQQSRVRLLVNTVAENKGKIQTGYESIGGVGGWELLEHISLSQMALKAAELSVRMLAAPPAPAGKMPVVMSSEAGGTMVHEACGHGLEADLVQKGLSVYKNKLGQKVAADCVSVIDDATLADKYGSYCFDDEGCRGQRNLLIEKGILKTYLYDWLSARRDGVASTGNGRRESYQHKPVVRMSNTLIAPGQDNPEDIIASTPHGLLVKKMGGGQVNTTNGDFVFDVQEGYLIQDGQIKHPVRGATLIGNGPLVLSNIDGVGHDLGFSLGVCGKDGQGVPVADAQPTIRIKELTVGGTA